MVNWGSDIYWDTPELFMSKKAFEDLKVAAGEAMQKYKSAFNNVVLYDDKPPIEESDAALWDQI